MSIRGKPFMRQSKFRHVFGQALKRDQCYDNVRITKNSWDATYCCCNPHFVAIITEAAGGGSFLVLPLSKTGRVDRDSPVVAGHKAPVLDIAFSPFNDSIIASASEDCMVKVWQIPEEGLVKDLTESIVDLAYHQKRVGVVRWHPVANNVLLSCGADCLVLVWNVGTEEILCAVELPDFCLSASFNPNGTRLAVTCKDKKLRILNPRTGDIIAEGKSHDGAKPSQAVYLKNGLIFTTGFSRMSERQYALWDDKRLDNLALEEIDSSNGVIFPFYDGDTNMVYLCGKGDSLIKFYEVTEEPPYVHFLNLYSSTEPQRGMGVMPKRGLNVNNNEIARFFKLHNSGLCEVLPFIVPRKSELFQADLYPDTPGDVPSLSAEEWFSGVDAEPILMSLKEGYTSTAKQPAKVAKKANILNKMPMRTVNDERPAPAAQNDVHSSTPASAIPPRMQNNVPAHSPAPAPAPSKPPPVATPTPAPVTKPLPVATPTPAPAPPVVKLEPTPAPTPRRDPPKETPKETPKMTSDSKKEVNSISSPPATDGLVALPPGFDPQSVLDDIRKLKLIVKAHERRIKSLEEKIAQYEAVSSDDDVAEA